MLSTRFKVGCLQTRVLIAAALLSAIFLVFYFPLVSRASRTWELERQKLIAASPVVYVAPYGLKYHQREHYDSLSSPLSLYEATERQYEYCTICRPAPPATLLPRPWYVSHPVLAVVSFSWLYVFLLLALLLVIRRRGKW
ncbi:MAG TPA: hypothetical protein VM866_07775 [Pyrinomonadaceae bacterium]|jgi:hypothetical protein|nr:hypothetical protein [Pyrinomonadaceae bacterium]